MPGRITVAVAALWLLVLLALWAGSDLAYVVTGAESDQATQADVIIVLGCQVYGDNGPSPCIRVRADHAAELYRRGLAARIIVTGGVTQDGPSEASVLDRVLVEDAVKPGDIVQEGRALNTIQNISYSQEIMQRQGWKTAILVTEPYHINRATLIARDAGLTVYPSPAVNGPSWQYPLPRIKNVAQDTASLALYQLKRVLGIRD